MVDVAVQTGAKKEAARSVPRQDERSIRMRSLSLCADFSHRQFSTSSRTFNVLARWSTLCCYIVTERRPSLSKARQHRRLNTYWEYK